jgi:hypothetical protein
VSGTVKGTVTSAPPTFTMRAWTPALVAAATLAVGYVDLARGGTTLSAMLLVAGYVVAVPWAIMKSGSRPGRPR